MLGIDEGSDAALLLRLGDGMDGEGGLTGALRAEDLDDAATRIAAHAECGIKGHTARRDDLYLLYLFIAHPHDGPFPKVFLYLGHRGLQGFQFSLSS